MAGETVDFTEIAANARERLDANKKREQSSILFPYLDLNTAIDVAKAMYGTRGHGSMEAHELAASMDQTISGAFRLKTGTARIFGLTERDGRDATKLSDLGRQIIEPETEKAARAEAFMRVPLYAAIYDKYKGQRLPPPKALEREMQSLGVSSKQTDKARQAFERSARQAGYFELGEDRLVRPRADLPAGGGDINKRDRREEEQEQEQAQEHEDKGRRGGGGDLHPFIEGLLQTLPKPETEWDTVDQGRWLQTAASIFGLIYKGDGRTISVSISSSQKTATDQ